MIACFAFTPADPSVVDMLRVPGHRHVWLQSLTALPRLPTRPVVDSLFGESLPVESGTFLREPTLPWACERLVQ